MTEITAAMGILKRLSGSLLLLKLAETVVPRLVAGGHVEPSSAEKILGQIPALRIEIARQIESVKGAMESIQDHVEAVAQLLLVHRTRLAPTEEAEVLRLLGEVRGAAT